MRQNEEADSPREMACAPAIGKVGRPQGIGQQARKRIGTHLRAMYEGVLQQPVPDRFADLIARLDDTPTET